MKSEYQTYNLQLTSQGACWHVPRPASISNRISVQVPWAAKYRIWLPRVQTLFLCLQLSLLPIHQENLMGLLAIAGLQSQLMTWKPLKVVSVSAMSCAPILDLPNSNLSTTTRKKCSLPSVTMSTIADATWSRIRMEIGKILHWMWLISLFWSFRMIDDMEQKESNWDIVIDFLAWPSWHSFM